MAIADDRLKNFFSQHKVGELEALKQKGKVQTLKFRKKLKQVDLTPPKKTIVDPLTNREQFVSDPLAIR